MEGFDAYSRVNVLAVSIMHVFTVTQSKIIPASKISYGELYHASCEKVDALRTDYALNVVVMWGCDWASLKSTDQSVKDFMPKYKKPETLDPATCCLVVA